MGGVYIFSGTTQSVKKQEANRVAMDTSMLGSRDCVVRVDCVVGVDLIT